MGPALDKVRLTVGLVEGVRRIVATPGVEPACGGGGAEPTGGMAHGRPAVEAGRLVWSIRR